ncbi:MAG: hypothetical protein GY822_00670 [Deltaproteobacteria bacterium]|nr:hypothetical protein [Deltaproteobacteria bacterium]
MLLFPSACLTGGDVDGGTIGDGGPLQASCFDISALNAELDKNCDAASDCSLEIVLSGCCGELHAIGVAQSAAAKVQSWSDSCGPEAVCDCVHFEGTADDGTVGPADASGANVDCISNVCTSSF